MSSRVHPSSVDRAQVDKGWRIVPAVSVRTGRQRWAIFYRGRRRWTKTLLRNAVEYIRSYHARRV